MDASIGLTRRAAVATLLTCGISSGSCINAEAQVKQLESTKATIGLAITDSTFLPIFLAEEKGYFKKEGLDVNITTFRGGADLARAMVAGAIDIGVSSPTAVISAIRAHQDMKVFFGGFNQMPFSWYAIPSIKTIAEAKGKRFAISRFGSATDDLTRYLLKAKGLNPDTDVKIIQGGESSARLAAMEAGQLDVGIFATPFNYIAAKQGYNLLAKQSDIMPDFPIQSFFATENYINGHTETIKAVLRSFIEGIQLAKSDKGLAVKTLIEKVHFDKAYAGEAYGDLIGGWREDGRLASPGGMKAFFEMAVASGDIDKSWPKEEYWDDRFTSTIDQWKPH